MSLFDLAFARQQGGKFILRIEDTDQARSTVESEQVIYHSLRWLGLQWDEGPDVGGPYGPYRQSERLSLYRQYAEQLVEQGEAYYCTCSPERLTALRQEQIAAKQPPGYDRHCRNLALRPKAGEPHVIRMKMPLEGESVFEDLVRGELRRPYKDSDDQVIVKSDGFPTYHLAVVVDDHLMQITHVMRGDDWISSFPKHILLYQAFGWEPPRHGHLPNVLGPDKKKLSKRHGATSVIQFRDAGYIPEALVNFLALLGWSYDDHTERFTRRQLIDLFTLDKIGKSPAVFSMDKLDSI